MNYEFYLTFEEIQSQRMGATVLHNISSHVGMKKQRSEYSVLLDLS